MKLLSRNPQQTHDLGRILGDLCEPGDVIALVGELGAGKTCLTKGIARGLGVTERYPVTSPTFTLVNEYPGRLALYHLDLYRLAGSDDLIDLGYEEYCYGRGITVVEWADKIKDILPEGSLFVSMTYIDETTREIELEGQDRIITKIRALLKEEGLEKWH
jgi:tRNA threonylcarbamoyladenosine biosynthesis protein TsaE